MYLCVYALFSVCMKNEFDISCRIYQAEGEIRHRRRENQIASNGKSHDKRAVIEKKKKQAFKGFVMRDMVRAATEIEGAERNSS